MHKTNNIRLMVLVILAILSGLLYFAVANPRSPLANFCEDTEYAAQQYANKDIKKRNKFIVERNNHCKVLLGEYKNAKNIQEKIESCTILDNALEASDKFIELKKVKDTKAVRENIKFFSENLDNFDYCPQYGDVAKKLKTLRETYR